MNFYCITCDLPKCLTKSKYKVQNLYNALQVKALGSKFISLHTKCVNSDFFNILNKIQIFWIIMKVSILISLTYSIKSKYSGQLWNCYDVLELGCFKSVVAFGSVDQRECENADQRECSLVHHMCYNVLNVNLNLKLKICVVMCFFAVFYFHELLPMQL